MESCRSGPFRVIAVEDPRSVVLDASHRLTARTESHTANAGLAR